MLLKKTREAFQGLLLMAIGLVLASLDNLYAIPSSLCSNCHTMHNSFQGSPMTNGTSSPQPLLLKYDCMGCHGMGGANRIAYLGNVPVPQVLHSDPSGDLAGGNFGYITGAKASNATNKNRLGHNVIELGSAYKETEANFKEPPGHPHSFFGLDWRNLLSCAGGFGCHGNMRYMGAGQGTVTVKGAHHNNVSGDIQETDMNATSGKFYRFLQGVWGYEVSDWQNTDSTHHNEYYGSSTPINYYYSDCNNCHTQSGGVQAKYHTISNFCGTCHGKFHEETNVGSSSPWLRHPTDRIIPNRDEFTSYTTYDVSVPVARTSVPSSPVSTVTPGQDVVMCLSCHYVHAGPYPSMLRWDYSQITAGGGANIGCKKCHSQK